MEVTRPKSPAAPSTSLKEAVEKLKILYEKEKRGPIDKDTAMLALGYSAKSGAGLRMLATLGQYGLIERQGIGHIRVTDLGMDIILPSDNQHELEALRQASRQPDIFVELLERYSDSEGLPSDNALISYLIKRTPIPFGDSSARGLAKAFRETLEFTEPSKADIKGNGGKGDTAGNGGEPPPVDKTPKPTPPKGLGLVAGDSNMRTDTFILGEGAMVALQYPATLSQASYQDFEDWIGLELRKIKRLISTKKEYDEKEQATNAEA
jgi:hypothetical protein